MKHAHEYTRDPRYVRILWPDGPRYVPASKIKTWALDSYENNAPQYRCLACGDDTLTEGDCPHDADFEPVYPEGTVAKPTSLGDAIEWLSSTGEVTFAREVE